MCASVCRVPASYSRVLFQDVEVVHYSEDVYNKHRVVACCRRSLRQAGVVGLHEAPCLRLLLQRLPLLLHEQYAYEKVGGATNFTRALTRSGNLE